MTSDPAPDPRAATRTPMLADQVDDLGDGEEVGRVAQLGDDLELVGEPALDGHEVVLARPGVAPGHRAAAPLLEHHLGAHARLDSHALGLGQVDRPDAQVVAGALGAGQPEGEGALDEGVGAAEVAAGDLAGDGVHHRGRREVRGVGDPVEVTGVEGDQPPGGVEDVDDRRLPRVDVAHRRGEHRGQPLLVGEAQQAARVAAGTPGCPRARRGRPPR